ncbi:MAG TPA: M1 family aminopeptidase [Anaerolineales bacterium]|nr:M1 family aminopeptidase [Anaerolineales bacterium]
MACSSTLPALPPAKPILVTIDPNSTSTATPFQPAPATDTSISSPVLLPSSTFTFTPLPTDTFTPAPTIPPASPVPVTARAKYTMYANLDYEAKTLAVNETITYFNATGQSLDNVVLAVEPNLWTDCFTLTSLTQNGIAITNYSLDGQGLTIYPSQPIQPGAVTTFFIGYGLAIPPKQYEGTFGYLSYQVNLTDWYPFIVPYSGGWVLHDPWAFGEHLVYDAADYEVNLKVDDPDVIVAASSAPESVQDWTRYTLDGARTFVISASDQFKVSESAVGSAVIRSYYFAGDEDAGQALIWMATQSLGLYGVKFAPYPYPVLNIVETEAPDGQEYDGLVFLAEKFYSEYNGTAKSNLFTIGTHEIAHQWWFGLVGNDQALEPWLDEALAVYSEKIFYEYNYPKYGDWWWQFRVNYFGPTGYVDSNIYSFGTFRSYVNAVYLNGANFLDDLRTRVGDDAFFAFLQDYAARFAHGRASTADFFAVLRLHTTKDFSDIMQTYFQNGY